MLYIFEIFWFLCWVILFSLTLCVYDWLIS